MEQGDEEPDPTDAGGCRAPRRGPATFICSYGVGAGRDRAYDVQWAAPWSGRDARSTAVDRGGSRRFGRGACGAGRAGLVALTVRAQPKVWPPSRASDGAQPSPSSSRRRRFDAVVVEDAAGGEQVEQHPVAARATASPAAFAVARHRRLGAGTANRGSHTSDGRRPDESVFG